MRYLHKIISVLIIFVVTFGVPIYATAQAAAPERGQVRLAHETEEQLLVMGCKKTLITNERALETARLQGQVAVIPVDATGEAVAVCSPQIIEQLQPVREGEVLGLMETIREFGGTFWENYKYYLGEEAETVLGAAADLALKAIKLVLPLLGALFRYLTIGGLKLFSMLALLVEPMLTLNAFTSSSVVQKFWPVVLGIANLGFLLALIIIALLVTLRLDVGGGVRKLLPRLLIGAVLINFSLIIGGAIIDFSRLLMALIANIDTGQFATLFSSFLAASGFGELVSVMDELNGIEGYGKALEWFLAAIIVWVVVIAAMVLTFSLLVRYLVLLLLLIVSPFAYIALAFPGAQKIAIAWWSTFLRYVIYGPIVLIILIVGTEAARALPDAMHNAGILNVAVTGDLATHLLAALIFATSMVFAAMAGRYAGIAGSTMALNLVSKGGKRARAMAYRGGSFAGRKGAKAAYVGSGLRRGLRETRAVAGKATEPIRKRFGLGEHSKFDAKTGKIKKGEKTAGGLGESMARGIGSKMGGVTGKKYTDAAADVKEMRDNISKPADIGHAALRNKDAGERLTRTETNNLAANVVRDGVTDKDMSKTITMVSNVEIVRKMDNAAQGAVLATGDAAAIKALNDSMRAIANENK